jgi:DNA repair protein RecO (recombination protein O)
MEWTDEGIVLGVRRHGESAAIVELMTQAHGRHLGIVRGGRSRRQQPVLQPGNRVGLVWRARIEEHLGTFAVEPLVLRAGTIMGSGLALQGINLVGALLRLLPERDPHPPLFETAEVIADHLHDAAVAPALMVRLELAVLTELGFGLDLARCAATGLTQDLIYVSPKSGRAVSRAAGEPWKDRLLPLPAFVRGQSEGGGASMEDVLAGFALTGHFLERDVFGPRNTPMPDVRHAFLAEVNRFAAATAKAG